MKKLFSNLKTTWDHFKRTTQAMWERFVFMQYKTMRRKRSFVHSVYHHHVKKGDRRYTLLIVETSFGRLIWNIGRHGVNELDKKYITTLTPRTVTDKRPAMRRTR